MRYISEISRRGLVNKLAEKIQKKLSENEKFITAIEVVDCINFLVVKGYTSNTTVLNLTDFKDEFIQQESEFLNKFGLKKLNLIDVIDYKQGLMLEDSPYWFEFWNSKRPMYPTSVIDAVNKELIPSNTFESYIFEDRLYVELLFPTLNIGGPIPHKLSPITVSSEFPYGYSLKAGKTKLYYCEHVCYQLFSVLNTNKISMKISNQLDDRGDLDINIIADSQYFDEEVKSMVLDIFDFNLVKFQSDYLKDYDFLDEIKSPFESKPWINKNKVRELMIV